MPFPPVPGGSVWLKTQLGMAGWLNATAAPYRADPSGIADSTAAFQNAVNALPAGGGMVYLPPGVYKTTGTVTYSGSGNVIIAGTERFATTVMPSFPGDAFRLNNPNYPASGFTSITGWGLGLHDMTIDGSNAGANSSGLHIGDCEEAVIYNVAIQHFNKTGSIGLHLDNTVWWTEKTRGQVMLYDCTTHAMYDVSGATTATNSFGYSELDLHIFAKNNQDGVTVNNGALPYHGGLKIRGNFLGGATATNAVIRLQGSVPAGHPNAGAGSQLKNHYLDVCVETSANTAQPQTIAIPAGTGISTCRGILDFGIGATFATSSPVGTFNFNGLVVGDTTLVPAGPM